MDIDTNANANTEAGFDLASEYARRFPFYGTASHGTLRTVPLILAFRTLLADVNDWRAEFFRSVRFDWGEREARRMRECDELCKDARLVVVDSEGADDILSDLFDALARIAPNGHTFGALEGDGSDFGFWPIDSDD